MYYVYCTLWYTVIYCGILWYTVMCCSILCKGEQVYTMILYFSTGQVLAEGKVTQKADIQPVESASYMKLKQ